MTRKKWGCALLTALCVLGCSGTAEQTAPGAEAETHPSGAYRVTWQTVSDSCQPAQAERTSEEVVNTSADKVGLVISADHRHQEISWEQPFSYTMSDCGVTFNLAVVTRSADLFVIDSEWKWENPTACDATNWLGTPSSDCISHQTVSYEFLSACPATLTGGSCQ